MAFSKQQLMSTRERKQEERRITAEAAVKEEQRLSKWRRVFNGEATREEGLDVIDEIIDRTGAMDSIHDTSARIHYNSGRQDLGLEFLADIMLADKTLYHDLVERWADKATAARINALRALEE